MCSAWQEVRRNGGSAGVDGERLADIESYGVERWLGELAGTWKEGTYRLRQVLIPKKLGKYRPLGIPCVRDRVAQTAAMLVLFRSRSGPGNNTPIGRAGARAMPSSTCIGC